MVLLLFDEVASLSADADDNHPRFALPRCVTQRYRIFQIYISFKLFIWHSHSKVIVAYNKYYIECAWKQKWALWPWALSFSFDPTLRGDYILLLSNFVLVITF